MIPARRPGAAALLLLLTLSPTLSAQTLAWQGVPAAALAEAQATGRPLLVLWLAGPAAAAFSQDLDRLWAAWPLWSGRLAPRVVALRLRSWDGPLPPALAFPGFAVSAPALALRRPGTTAPEAVWTEIPPVLDLARHVAALAADPLPDPYDLSVRSISWDGTVLTRVGSGPVWTPGGTGLPWVEEGPVGGLLFLREQGGRRAAFPLDSGWAYLYQPATQTWLPWQPVLVKGR